MRELLRHEVAVLAVQCRAEIRRRVLTVLQKTLVTGCAGIAHVGAGELPHDPVGRLYPPLGPRVDAGGLLEDLQGLRELPCGGDDPPVARKPCLAPLACQRRDAISVFLSRMVLPELDVGMRLVLETWDLVQWCAGPRDREPWCTR